MPEASIAAVRFFNFQACVDSIPTGGVFHILAARKLEQ